MMKLQVNGKPYEHEGKCVMTLLQDMGANPASSAVMVNSRVISAPNWPTTLLSEGDRVEVLVFAGGG